MKSFEQIVRTIARENDTTPQAVLDGMQQAIDLARADRNSPAAPLWQGLSCGGEGPDPETLVLQLAVLLQCTGEPAC